MADGPTDRGHSIVAVILAVGIATAINVITAAVLYDAIFSAGPGLSANATTLLTTAFGGIIGVLGSFIGYRAGQANGTSGVGAALHGGLQRGDQAGQVPLGGDEVGVPEDGLDVS